MNARCSWCGRAVTMDEWTLRPLLTSHAVEWFDRFGCKVRWMARESERAGAGLS
jgi:hypothetical protein